MKVSAIKNHVSTNAAIAGNPNPNFHATAADITPVNASTNGYRALIDLPQLAHRPRKKSQLITGMFCSAVIGALHDGHAERGTTRLKRSLGADETATAASALLFTADPV